MSEHDDEREIELPPEGATCAEHPERGALAVCPRCGAYACLACWHQPIRRCHACLMRDPAAAAPPIAWEEPGRGLVSRLAGTMKSALRPISSAPAFARGDAAAPRSFVLLTFVPLALLGAIVPFTHTLLFGPTFQISTITPSGGVAPDAAAIALDVAQAAGIGLLLGVAQLVALAVPYASLSRAYANGGHPPAPVRAVLYRAFLLPLAEVLYYLVVWSAPESPPEALLVIAALLRVLPLALLFASLRAAARMASGTGPFASLAVTLVPFAAMLLVNAYATEALRTIAPVPVAPAAPAAELAPAPS